MPMDPMDAMWNSKPPTFADTFGSSNVTFKSAVKPVERKMTISEGETFKMQDPPSPVAIPRTRHFSISETFGSPLLQAFSWASAPRQRSVSVCESDQNLKEFKEMVAKKMSTDN